MVEKCPARYKNLNYIQSFSEQGYATIQLMQQACMNDEWLRQRVLKLAYLTSPAIRKWYGKQFQNWIDSVISYGYKFDSNGNIIFNNTIQKLITVDFVDDDEKIDFDKTTAAIVAFDLNSNKVVDAYEEEENKDLSSLETNYDIEKEDYDSEGGIISLDSDGEVTGITEDSPEVVENIIHRCQLPYENEADKYTYTNTKIVQKAQSAAYDLTTRTIKKNQSCNSSWYIGFNKSKNYYVRPDWLKTPKGWKDSEIPSVARGQTFKATVTGWLDSIDLKLNYSGTKHSDCGSPLYVQIWSTTKDTQPKTVWNRAEKKMEYVYKRNKQNKGNYNLVNAGTYVESKSKTGSYNYVNGSYVYTPNFDGKYDLVGRKFKQVKKGTGKFNRVYEKIIMPKPSIYSPLAQAIYDPSKMKAFDLVNIEFDKPVKLDKGKSYFIALFSPLSENSHCPFWGGWGRNCAKDKKYEYGHAFLSEDNGRTWIRYGREDSNVTYREGRYVPQDFAFQCHIRTRDKKDEITETITTTETDQFDDASIDNPVYLYLKPIFDNPITHVRITADDYGSSPDSLGTKGVGIKYDFKTNHMSEWQTGIDLERKYEISPNDKGEYPHILYVRARLYRDVTTKENGHDKYYKDTPYIDTLSVEIDTQLPKELYVRTVMYEPALGTVLGANIWSRLYSVFDTDPTVTCTAEIVTNIKPTDHFKIIEVENVKSYAEQKGLDSTIITSLEEVINNDSNIPVNDRLCEYLYNNQNIIKEFKKKNVYIKPYEKDDYTYLMSFSLPDAEDMMISTTNYKDSSLGGIEFSNMVAYPILECTLTPDNSTNSPTSYSEWHDYTFDYENNILTFKKDVLDSLSIGDVAVSYNKVFIRGLTKEEVGVRVDVESGVREEGLILDYFKETFIIDDEDLQSKKIKLRVEPLDPIREVVLNRDTESELELYEGYDFEVDIENHELEFKVNNTDNVSTVLSKGDILEVVYTPNLNATGVSVGYYAKRTNTDKNVRIGSSYWEYKV